jgi:O-glycosyl hydrolase
MKITFLLLLAFLITIPLFSQHTFTLDESKSYQTIHGFGASDAWSNDFLLLMDDSSRSLVADWLFSKKQNSDGSFRGIGLSVWRYNLGAGSSEQADSSYIPDPYRRTECFLNADGTYNWNKQSGAQWIIKAAKERGLENFVMFSNSPPVSLTRNGKAFAATCGVSNLSPENNQAFADYAVQSVKYFEDNNIHFEYMSPVNEPEWDWCQRDGQEGCPYKNQQTAELVRLINRGLLSNSLTTEVQIPESGLLVFANAGLRSKPGRQNEIEEFFKNGRKTYIGDEKQVARQICAHSYFTEWPLWIMRSVRKKTARKSERYDLEYWMTEYCILRKTKEMEGGGRDLGIKTALYVSRVIHHDLVYGNASAWCWWLGISTADFKDGLAYVNRNGTGLTDSKTMWALGNFSQFIHPGAFRLEVNGKRDKELFVSAYRNKGSDNIVIVIINMKSEKQLVKFKNLPDGTLTAWETSKTLSLEKSYETPASDLLSVSPESITTYVLSRQIPK